MPDGRFSGLEALTGAANRLLVVVPAKADMDTLAAASVLAFVWQREGKAVTVVTAGRAAWPEPLETLVPTEPAVSGFRALEIRLPVRQVPLDSFSYDIRGQELRIELLPKQGQWPREDVSVEPGAVRFDALVVLNAPSAEALAGLVPQDPEWFRALPSAHLALDGEAAPWAGTDISLHTHASLCEALLPWLKDRAGGLDKRLAHNLLTGLIDATNGFRGPRVRSETLLAASELVALGADRQDIVNRLWRTVSIPALNLWGRGLMRLALKPDLGLALTLLTEHDFLQAETDPSAVAGLGRYLFDRLPDTGLILVLTAWNGQRRARLFARKPLDAALIARWFGGNGEPGDAEWPVEAPDLLEAQRTILQTLERELPRLARSR